MDLTPPRVQRSVGIVQTVEKCPPFRRFAVRTSTMLLVLCLVVTPLCASWCAAAPCHPSLLSWSSSSSSEACHHGEGKHAGKKPGDSDAKAMAKEIACPPGEYLVASRELGTLGLDSCSESKAPRNAALVSALTTMRQATSDDFPRNERRLQIPSSMFSDLSLPLRI